MEDLVSRSWDDLVDRIGGPLTFRFLLQPLMAVFLATRSGLRDAREGGPAFFWAVVEDPVHRAFLLRQGWKEVWKLFGLAVILDVLYSVLVFHWVYPAQTLLVAVLLAIVPYLVVRGLITRLASRLYTPPTDSKESDRMSQETVAPTAPHPDQATLALERTYLAHERTLLAWIRTAAALITFGFTLYKYFLYLHEQHPTLHVEHLLGPRTFGLLMMSFGVIALALATWQHRQRMLQLHVHYHAPSFTMTTVLAAMIAILGTLGVLAAALRS